jgi:hypothetical protein
MKVTGFFIVCQPVIPAQAGICLVCLSYKEVKVHAKQQIIQCITPPKCEAGAELLLNKR